MRVNQKLSIAAVILGLIATGYGVVAQDQIDNIGISRVGPPIVRIALPELRSTPPGDKADQLTQVFNETLWNDLVYSGNLEVSPRSFYPVGTFALPADIKVEDWTKPGVAAEYVAYGSIALQGATFRATGRLRNLAAPQDSIGSVFPGADTEAGARLAAHTFADRILETLGFGRGIARTSIAFVSDRSGDKEIYTMDYDGNNQQRLTSIRFIAITPSWSPVDDRIAITAWRPGTQAQIEIISATGGRYSFQQSTAVTNNVPSWSPDGQSIVFSTRRDGNFEIYRADTDGRNARRLTNSRGIDTSPSFNPANPNQIVFVSDRSGSPQIYIMNADGTNVLRITEEGGEAGNPAWSPDGSMIAFTWQKPKTGTFDLYLYEIRSDRFIQLTSGAGRNERPTWAPDGKHIAFQSDRNGSMQIYSMTLDGKNVRQLTSRGINEGPAWSGYTR